MPMTTLRSVLLVVAPLLVAPLLVAPLLVAPLLVVAVLPACSEPLITVRTGEVECVLDRDCGEGVCQGGACAPAPADAGAPAPDAGPADAGVLDAGQPDVGAPDAGQPDAGAPDAGEPDAGEPDAGPQDAGQPDAGQPDAGPPPQPQVLRVTSRPEANDPFAACYCATGSSSANVDLALVAAVGGVCTKPSGAPDCGLGDPGCACVGPGLGTAWWSSDGAAVEFRPGELWIANEEVVREAGPDGTLSVRATLVDDCIRSPNSLNYDVMFACFLLDCRNEGGPEFAGPTDCVDYTQYDRDTCPVAVRNYMALSPFVEPPGLGWSQAPGDQPAEDCLAHGPAAVRVTVEVQGEGGFVRQFCSVLSQDQAVEAVQLASVNDRYEVIAISPDVVEVPPGTECPAAQ